MVATKDTSLGSSILAHEPISPGVPFDRPILVVPPDLDSSTTSKFAEHRQAGSNDLAEFDARNLIERTIIEQTSTATDKDCLASLINNNAGLPEGTILKIFKELFLTPGEQSLHIHSPLPRPNQEHHLQKCIL